jgi:hypothetical protein
MDFSTEDDTIDMPPVQLHFDVGHAPAHLLVDDGPDQNITLTAALSQAAAIENEAERFHHQVKEERNLDYFAKMYRQKDKHSALQVLRGRKEIKLEGSQYLAGYEDQDLAWQVESHYLDMQICVGRGLGLAAMLPNVSIHHAVEFRLMLGKESRRFGAKYAKLGFDPTNCMLWIGRSSNGEDSWLAWVPTDCMGPLADNRSTLTCSGKEDTKMARKHYRITIMFLADMLRQIGHRDITVTEPYPDITNDNDFKFATNAL